MYTYMKICRLSHINIIYLFLVIIFIVEINHGYRVIDKVIDCFEIILRLFFKAYVNKFTTKKEK